MAEDPSSPSIQTPGDPAGTRSSVSAQLLHVVSHLTDLFRKHPGTEPEEENPISTQRGAELTSVGPEGIGANPGADNQPRNPQKAWNQYYQRGWDKTHSQTGEAWGTDWLKADEPGLKDIGKAIGKKIESRTQRKPHTDKQHTQTGSTTQQQKPSPVTPTNNVVRPTTSVYTASSGEQIQQTPRTAKPSENVIVDTAAATGTGYEPVTETQKKKKKNKNKK